MYLAQLRSMLGNGLTVIALWLGGAPLLGSERLPADHTAATVRAQAEFPPNPQTIASVRSTLDPVDFVPTDTNSLFCVEGWVTTHRNLIASPDLLFFLQDDTGGIGIRLMRGSTNRIAAPGTRVRVTGQLADRNGVLELRLPASELATQLQVFDDTPVNVSATPLDLDFLNPIDAPRLEALEGTLVRVSGVYFEAASDVFVANRNAWLTNSMGERVALYVSTHSNLPGQWVPRGAVEVVAVLAQDDTRLPKTAGYHLLPCCYSEILASQHPPALQFTNEIRPASSSVSWTNQDLELSLVPGDRWSARSLATSPSNLRVEMESIQSGVLENANIVVERFSDDRVLLSMEMEIQASMRGSPGTLKVKATNPDGAEERVWTLYVPTEAEQRCIVTELLANPTTHPDSPLYNPLLREEPAGDKAASQDEYLELLNYSDQSLDLSGWTLSDDLQTRHRFAPNTLLAPWDGLVVYGGPTNGASPQLPCPAIPASTGTLSLNNDSETLRIRNAEGRLLQQIEYRKSMLGTDSSVVRSNLPAGPFLPHSEVGPWNTSPGKHTDGAPFGTPLTEEVRPFPVHPVLEEPGTMWVRWTATPGRFYTVWTASRAEGPYQKAAERLETGEYSLPIDGQSRFLRVSTP